MKFPFDLAGDPTIGIPPLAGFFRKKVGEVIRARQTPELRFIYDTALDRGRRIDDILLELGFASEESLAKARIEHEKTGQPLGTILVEQGAITRLELASALAEQWSDQSASIKLLPIPSPAITCFLPSTMRTPLRPSCPAQVV